MENDKISTILNDQIDLTYMDFEISTYVHLFGIAHKPFTQFSHLAKSEILDSNSTR